MIERDKFLAVKVDINNEFFTNGCDHFLVGSGYHHPRICATCGCRENVDGMPDFSTWDGFGVLIEFLDSEWSDEEIANMLYCVGCDGCVTNLPSNCANYVYDLLKERNG